MGANALPTARGRAERAAAGSVTLVERMWFNSANTSTWYLVPGLIVLIMTLVGAFLTAMVMAREWERGTLEALFVSPVRPTEILLAKIIPYFLVGMLGLGMCLVAARFLFQVPMFGSFLIVLGSSMLYMLVALGIGLVISSSMKNQFLASQIALITSFMPALMLSGFLFDLRNVPTVIYLVGQLLPATYFMELIRTLFLAGNVWPLILKNSAILVAYAVLLLGLARFVTRKKPRLTHARLSASRGQPVPERTAGHPERSRQPGDSRGSLAGGELSVRLCGDLRPEQRALRVTRSKQGRGLR